MKHSNSLVCLCFALICAASGASAQPVAPSIQSLLSTRHPSRRLSAARAIVRLRPEGGREALERTLEDTTNAPRVRVAAASALGDYGDSRAIAALNRHTADSDRGVQFAVHHALDALRAGSAPAPGSPAAATPMPPTNWRRVRTAIAVGTIVHHAHEANAYNAQFRAALERELALQPGVGFVSATPSPEASQRLSSNAVRRFSLEGGVARVRRVDNGGSIQIRAEVSLLLIAEPAHTIIGTMDGSASASESAVPGATRPDVGRLMATAIEGAVHSSVSRLSEELNAASAVHHSHHRH